LNQPDFDCTSCGACCFSKNQNYVRLLAEDRNRPIPALAVHEADGRRYLRMAGDHCSQLCRTADARLVCGIYEARPEACRAFRAGSFECRMARLHCGALAEAMRLPANVDVLHAPGPDMQRPEADVLPAQAEIVPGRQRRPD
jgi:Fe-S-cluster containining protein